jgi:hypothetical protein
MLEECPSSVADHLVDDRPREGDQRKPRTQERFVGRCTWT